MNADQTPSETTSIPVNPRTTKPVGYAFVDLATSSEAERAVSELNDKTILERKVSVQLARKPDEPVHAENGDALDGEARRPSGRGRGRGRGRGGRTARGGRNVSSINSRLPLTANAESSRVLAMLRVMAIPPRTPLLPTFPLRSCRLRKLRMRLPPQRMARKTRRPGRQNLVSLANLETAARQRMGFLPRLRLWLRICHMTCVRTGYVYFRNSLYVP